MFSEKGRYFVSKAGLLFACLWRACLRTVGICLGADEGRGNTTERAREDDTNHTNIPSHSHDSIEHLQPS